MLNYKQIWHGIKPIRWLNKFNLTDSIIVSLSPPLVFVFALLVCFSFMFWVSLVLYFPLFNMFLFIFSFVYYFHIKKIEKYKKYKNSEYFVYIGTCVPWMAIEIKFSKLYIFCSLDEHLYAQLSKWALWLVFVMSKFK